MRRGRWRHDGGACSPLERSGFDHRGVHLFTWQAAGDGAAVYTVDLSVWPRSDAEASPERGFYYHPSRHSAGQPIVAGWAYQWLAQLSFTQDSWTTPLDVRRVHPRQNANVIAVEQITNLLSRLPHESPPPLFVFDAGYNSAHLTRGVVDLPVAVLVRLRGDRCFYADPPPVVPSPKGGVTRAGTERSSPARIRRRGLH